MSLTKWNANESLIPSIDSIWDNFFGKDFFKKGFDLGTSMPAVNTKVTEKEYSIEVAIPGMKKEDLKVKIDKDTIIISSESKDEKEEKEGETIIQREFSYSSFKRSFLIPNHVQSEAIEAEYNN